MNKLITLLIFITPLLSPFLGTANYIRKIDSVLNYCNKNHLFNGSVLVFEKGKIIYNRSIGLTDIRTGSPLTNQNQYNIGSISKTFTSTAILKLKEQDRLSLDDRILDHLPGLPDYLKDVKIRHLLTHTSGIPLDYELFYQDFSDTLSNQHYLDFLKQKKLSFKPGESFSYSNCGYVLLSLIVEKCSGQTFANYISDEILTPSGLINTVVNGSHHPNIPNQVNAYNLNNEVYVNHHQDSGPGNLYSTAEDLFTWLQVLKDEKVISQNTFAEATKPTKLDNDNISNYGFGWHIDLINNQKFISHSGASAGYNSFVCRSLSENTGWILLSNVHNWPAKDQISGCISSILNDEPFLIPKAPISVLYKYHEYLKDYKKTISVIENGVNENRQGYLVDDFEMLKIGEGYLNQGRPQKAIDFFEFALRLSPNSAILHNALGEVYNQLNNPNKAIEEFNEAMKRYPYYSKTKSNLSNLNSNDLTDTTNSIRLGPQVLKKYKGKYLLTIESSITINVEGHHIYFQPANYSSVELFPITETRFYCRKYDMEIIFETNSLTMHRVRTSRHLKIE